MLSYVPGPLRFGSSLSVSSLSPHLLKISIFKCAQRINSVPRLAPKIDSTRNSCICVYGFVYFAYAIITYHSIWKCSFEYAQNEHACNPVFGEMCVPFDREILQYFFSLRIHNFSNFQIYAAKRLDLHKKSKQTFAANLNLMEPKNICFNTRLFFSTIHNISCCFEFSIFHFSNEEDFVRNPGKASF